jgi:rare lipoprotein A (peptidoglycan hydrolase)
MQTKLTTAILLLAVSLLWTPSEAFAATQKTKAQKNLAVQGKPQFIGTASQKHSTTRTVKLVWCDLHVCQEKPRLVGKASFYGKGYWQGKKMANGQPFDYRKKTVALWHLSLGTMVRITNLENGKSVVAEVTDRGPAHSLHRIADLSQAAAEELGYTEKGVATVLIQPVVQVEIASTPLPTFEEPQIEVDKTEVASVL